MLATKVDGVWTQWTPGTRCNGLWPPRKAETLLSDKELADLGLYRVTVEAIPDGKVVTGWSLVDVKGLPVHRPTLEDAPPPAPVYIPVATLRERLEAVDKWDSLIAALPPAKLAKLLSLREGVSPHDDEARFILTAIGADPDKILAEDAKAG